MISDKFRTRCAALSVKSREGTITPEEYEELMALIDRIEMMNAERIAHLVKLAQLWQMSLVQLSENE
jgi:ABC-type sugar transport system ATPase subunit